MLTPHAGEFARLTGGSLPVRDPVAAARGFARAHRCTLVLKGRGTVTAAPEGKVWLCGTGNPGMAKGGSGDVLAGMIAALLGQKHLNGPGVSVPETAALAVLLTACGGTAAGDPAEELALAVRGEYLAMERCAAEVEITADYGQRVYEFLLSAAVDGEETVLTLREPELAAGITARISEEGGVLEYDGLALETGPLDGDGLSPVSALPALLSAARSEYMAECTLERTGDSELLRVLCADPEDPPGTGRETALWFDPETYALVRGEISVDGYRVIQCELTGFTRG